MKKTYLEVESAIARNLGLKVDEILNNNLSISDVISKSPTAINSIDIFEAFAGSFAEYGVDGQLNLPAFTLEDKIDDVLTEIRNQIEECEDIT